MIKDPVAFVPMLVFGSVDQLPVLSQVLQSEEVILKLNSFHLPIVILNSISSQSFDKSLSMCILLY